MEVEADGADDGDDQEHEAHLRRREHPGEALADAAHHRRGLAAALKRHELFLPHQQEPGQDGEERDRVDREADPDAERGDQDAGDRGADDARRVEEAGVQGNRVRQLVAAHHLEGERMAAGRVEDESRSGEDREQVDEPQRLRAGEHERRKDG